MRRAAALAVLAFALGAAPASAAVQLVPVGDFNSPIFVTAPPGDGQRLFVVERDGRIQVVSSGIRKQFLDIAASVSTDGERGLLSMAFAPDYASSGLFYVFRTAVTTGNVVIEEYRRSALDADKADPAPTRTLLDEPHNASNHNGGQLQFGPDGRLYATIGDNATSSNAQATSNVYGKLHRFDAATGAREIWALGLRNPWRFSFDRQTGDLWIADVGAGSMEEVDHATASGLNFGWPSCEGPCSPANPAYTDPTFSYSSASGTNCAITGGYVARAADLPSLAGRYVYGDYCTSRVRSLVLGTSSSDRDEGLPLAASTLVSFGEDACGYLYAIGSDGPVYRLTESATPPACDPATVPPPSPPPPPPAPQPSTQLPPPPAATKDTTPPRLTVSARRRQAVARRRHVRVAVACGEPCRVKVQATLVIRGHRRIKLRGVIGSISARTSFEPAAGRRARRAIRAALRAHRRMRIDVRVVASDTAGNAAAPQVKRITPAG